MFPTLLQLGPVTISSFGVMIALGFFLGSFLIWQRGKEEHFEEDFLMDGILLVSIVGLIISRVWQVIFKKPGFSWQGALLGGIFTLVIYCKKRKWNFYKLADLSVFGIVLGLILGKIGLFLNNSTLQPAFLIEAILLIVTYRFLSVFDKNYRTYEWYKNKRGEANPGFLFLSFLGLSTLIHLGAGIFQNPSFEIFKSFQFIVNLLIILTTIGFFYYRSKDHNLTISLPWFRKKRKVQIGKFRFKAGMEAKK